MKRKMKIAGIFFGILFTLGVCAFNVIAFSENSVKAVEKNGVDKIEMQEKKIPQKKKGRKKLRF